MPYKPNPRIRGEANGRTLFSPEQVRAMQRLVARNASQTLLAEAVNVSPSTINHIVSQRN